MKFLGEPRRGIALILIGGAMLEVARQMELAAGLEAWERAVQATPKPGGRTWLTRRACDY